MPRPVLNFFFSCFLFFSPSWALAQGEKKLLPTNSANVDFNKMGLKDFIDFNLQRINYSEDEIFEKLLEAPGTAGEIFRQYPKLARFSSKLITQKEIVKGLFKILENRQRLIYFTAAMMVTVFLGFIWRHYQIKSGKGMFSGFFKRLFLINLIRFGIIYFFFRLELGPLARAVKESIFP